MLKIAIASIALLAVIGDIQAQTPAHSAIDHVQMDHAAHMAAMADPQRQDEVSRRGKDVMPFSLAATTHVFTKNAQGGVQRVVAKKPADAAQVRLVRQHLKDIREQFLKGDFSGPSHIHGQDMPGLAELRAATPGHIAIIYEEVADGGELIYKTSDATLITAIHQWFDAQLSDHGNDAMEGR